jgi:hypothetical protein
MLTKLWRNGAFICRGECTNGQKHFEKYVSIMSRVGGDN